MNQSLTEKRMAEYTIVNTYPDTCAISNEEAEDKMLCWMEDILNKYSDVDGY